MSAPSKPDTHENKRSSVASVNRDPSYPDRARIDSDVRAFLRPASSPWIVFDRDSRVDDFAKAALRVGAVFASSPSFRPEAIKAAEECGKFVEGFPPSASSPESVAEPSNLVVATDVASGPSLTVALFGDVCVALESDPLAPLPVMLPHRARVTATAGACAGVFAAVVAVAIFLSGEMRSHGNAKVVSATPDAPLVVPLATQAEAPVAPPTVEVVEVQGPLLALSATTPTGAAPTSTASLAVSAEPPKKRLGRLSIKGDARHKSVWFDGKRMLGSGQRSFVVFCGLHTVAVGNKGDAKDIEVPCNGEYVVSK